MILLDTHVVLWLAQVPEMLSSRAREAIAVARQEDGLAIADKTLWELAMMMQRGVVTARSSPEDFLRTVENKFTVLPITAAIAARSLTFSVEFPKDPTDRLIAATAIVHHLPLVTKDGKIRQSKELRCIW